MQEGMLYHYLENRVSTSYHVQSSIWVEGDLKFENIKRSLDCLTNRHEALKTSIVIPKSTGKARQIVLKEREIELEDIKRYGESREKVEKEIKAADLKRGFDLQKDSLLRLKVVSFSENNYLFLFSVHHLIIDGWSLSLVFRDFFHYLGQLEKGKTFKVLMERIELEKKKYPEYSEYVKWLEKQDKESGLAYWKDLLLEYEEPAEIKPLRKLRSTSTDEQVAVVKDSISRENTEALSQTILSHQATLNTMMETVWGLILQAYNDTTDVVFGKVVSGRNAKIDQIEETVGLLIHTIPVRVKIESNMTARRFDERATRSSH